MIDRGANGDLQNELSLWLAEYEIRLPPDQVEQLQRYCQLLWQWNKKINLTRHTDYQQFVARDIVDSLHLADLLLPNESVLDVGTGGGMPGILLAILRPDLSVSLCESIGKKVRAVASMVDELGLSVALIEGRAEVILEDTPFDTLVARAVGPLPRMLKWFQPHWQSIGRLLAVKGPNWVAERKEARERGLLRDLELRKAAEYKTPGADTDNVILKIWHKSRSEL